MTDYIHKPVMVSEVVAALRCRSGGRYADGTTGGAGHAASILTASAPKGWLFGSDRDSRALEAARKTLAPFEGRFELVRCRFEDLGAWLEAGTVDGALLDLGVSSPQLDVPERGFSFREDGPLDMRMDQNGETETAADLVNEAGEAELARWFRDYGDERHARRVARAICREREQGRIGTTGELATLVAAVVPAGRQRIHPATRVFQALRMAVNDELGTLRRGLPVMLDILRPGGRLAVISFHGVEHREVRRFGREQARDYAVPGEVDVPELRVPKAPRLRLVTRKALVPGEAELKGNPRARSAQLRVFEKI